jgi:hypothetical protein
MPSLEHDSTEAMEAALTLIVGVLPVYNCSFIFIDNTLALVVDFVAFIFIMYFPFADPFYT